MTEETWYNMHMKIWAILILFPAAAFGVAVGPLPPSEFVDTEVR